MFTLLGFNFCYQLFTIIDVIGHNLGCSSHFAGDGRRSTSASNIQNRFIPKLRFVVQNISEIRNIVQTIRQFMYSKVGNNAYFANNHINSYTIAEFGFYFIKANNYKRTLLCKLSLIKLVMW